MNKEFNMPMERYRILQERAVRLYSLLHVLKEYISNVGAREQSVANIDMMIDYAIDDIKKVYSCL